MYFPSSQIIGIDRNRFYAAPADWDKITDSWEYEDGVPDFNEVADSAPRRWEYGYELINNNEPTDPLSAQQFDDFNNAARKSNPFNFLDKNGVYWSNVFIEEYSRTHEEHKPWVQNILFKLVGYNSQIVTPTNPSISLSSINIVGSNVIVTGTVSEVCDLRLFINGDFYELINDNGSFTFTVPLTFFLPLSTTFYVIAANANGGYAISNSLFIDFSVPTNPAGLAAVAVSSSQINVSWNPQTVAGFELQRSTSPSFTSPITISLGNVSFYLNTGLTSSTTYYYRLRALNILGVASGWSSIASATTNPIQDYILVDSGGNALADSSENALAVNF